MASQAGLLAHLRPLADLPSSDSTLRIILALPGSKHVAALRCGHDQLLLFYAHGNRKEVLPLWIAQGHRVLALLPPRL